MATEVVADFSWSSVATALIGNGPIGVALLVLASVGKSYLSAMKDERQQLIEIIRNNTDSISKNTSALEHLLDMVQMLLGRDKWQSASKR